MSSFVSSTRFLLRTVLGFTGISSLVDATSAAAAAASRSEPGWRSDLPWEDLASKLSESASLIDTSFENFKEECFPEFVNYYNMGPALPGGNLSLARSNHALIDQPSGLCSPHLFCGWDMCYPRPSDNGHSNQTFDQFHNDLTHFFLSDNAGLLPAEIIDSLLDYVNLPKSFDLANPDSFVQDPFNPSLNLPSKVLFPVVASDLVAAIQFTDNHGLEISVKNSGHSYQGASSKRNTLHLNMNRYTDYAPTGVTDCNSINSENAIAGDLSNQPCHLSLAKNKPATIRVGGGENWGKFSITSFCVSSFPD